MDPQNQRLIDEVRDNEDVMNALRELFESEAADEDKRSTACLVEARTHEATVHAVKADTLRQVVGLLLLDR